MHVLSSWPFFQFSTCLGSKPVGSRTGKLKKEGTSRQSQGSRFRQRQHCCTTRTCHHWHRSSCMCSASSRRRWFPSIRTFGSRTGRLRKEGTSRRCLGSRFRQRQHCCTTRTCRHLHHSSCKFSRINHHMWIPSIRTFETHTGRLRMVGISRRFP